IEKSPPASGTGAVSNFSPRRPRSDNHILTRLALIWIKPVGMSALGQKRTSVSLCPLCASRAVQSETIDATTDHDIVQPLTIRLLGSNFFGGRIQPLVILPKSRLLAR